MDKETLKKEIARLGKECGQKIREILIEYCDANNPFKVGDTFTDHIGTIKIEKIGYYLDAHIGTGSCEYFGPVLNKDGKPKKDNRKRTAWQINKVEP